MAKETSSSTVGEAIAALAVVFAWSVAWLVPALAGAWWAWPPAVLGMMSLLPAVQEVYAERPRRPGG